MSINPRTVLLAVAALVTAGLTAFLVHGWMERQRARMTPPQIVAPKHQKRAVLVARTNLGAGSFVQPDSIRWQVWPEGDLPESYIVRGKRKESEFVGSVVRRGILAGQPITDSGVVKVGERGFLAAVLKPGMRAISVSVNASSSIAGLVFPGDRVDLILTHKFRGDTEGGSGKKLRQAAETVLVNVRILAIDQRTDDQTKEKAKVPKTATLELTPKQVEMVNVALTLGHLSLSLRSLAKHPDAKDSGKTKDVATRGRTVTRDTEVSGLLAAPGDTVTVLRGSGKKK